MQSVFSGLGAVILPLQCSESKTGECLSPFYILFWVGAKIAHLENDRNDCLFVHYFV